MDKCEADLNQALQQMRAHHVFTIAMGAGKSGERPEVGWQLGMWRSYNSILVETVPRGMSNGPESLPIDDLQLSTTHRVRFPVLGKSSVVFSKSEKKSS
jgi:hypothetical protein